MLPEYDDVIVRFLKSEEKSLSSSEETLPLIIEAKNERSNEFLYSFLTNYPSELKRDLDKYGAILIRGFDVKSDDHFEKAVLNIKGFQGIENTFMSEEGRDHVNGTKFVLHTNTIYKTGGALKIPAFHTENYFTPDVPHYICFFCLTPSNLGGETGIANMEKVYSDLNTKLKIKLEESSFFSIKWPISEICEAYNIPENKIDDICDVCKQFGLTIAASGKDKFLVLYKPSVLENPVTKMKSLQAHFDIVPGIYAQISKQFIGDYQGKKWLRLRISWNFPTFSLLLAPMKLILHDQKMLNKMAKRHGPTRAFNQKMLRSVFSKDDVAELALSIRNHFSATPWKSGDILLIDNTKIAHAGMPGDGSLRIVRAMICNPLKFDYSFPGTGILTVKESAAPTLGDVLASFKTF